MRCYVSKLQTGRGTRASNGGHASRKLNPAVPANPPCLVSCPSAPFVPPRHQSPRATTPRPPCDCPPALRLPDRPTDSLLLLTWPRPDPNLDHPWNPNKHAVTLALASRVAERRTCQAYAATAAQARPEATSPFLTAACTRTTDTPILLRPALPLAYRIPWLFSSRLCDASSTERLSVLLPQLVSVTGHCEIQPQSQCNRKVPKFRGAKLTPCPPKPPGSRPRVVEQRPAPIDTP